MSLFGGFSLADLQPLALVTQPPIGFGPPGPIFKYQPMSRAQLVNTFDHCVRRGDEFVLQILSQGEQIDAPLDLRVDDQRFQFGGEDERARGPRKIERLFARPVARDEQAPPALVPKREREHPVQMVDEVIAMILVKVNNDLGVRMRAESVAARKEPLA